MGFCEELAFFDSTYSILLGILPLVGEGPEPGQIPNDEIWYTSEEGNIIIPYKESSLPTIVSNTYSNGKGIIKFATEVTSIGSQAFRNRGLTTITIPNSVTSIGAQAFYNCSLTSITIPNGVTSIGNYAFRNCQYLPSITIPNSVNSIGRQAFQGCISFTSVTIPNSVTSIGYNPFEGCENLTSIIVESGNTVYDSRNNCNAIINTEINTIVSGCQNTIIPNDIKEISPFSFSGCTGLTSIEIPVSVLYILDQAFYGCTGLSSISYTGTIEQYNAISKGQAWNYNVPATVVHCTDGDAPI